MLVQLACGDLSATLTTAGGALLRFDLAGERGAGPLLVARGGDAPAAFPMLPFAGRIAGNRFPVAGRDIRLAANTADPLRLHGDGWLSEWTVGEVTPDAVTLRLERAAGGGAPWAYRASQSIRLGTGGLSVTLAIENVGEETLPFGLGWHPYFPMTADTQLGFRAGAMWTDGPGYLPERLGPPPADLDFSRPAPLPERWINNGFEGWDGLARIDWPDRNVALVVDAEPPFSRLTLFRPTAAFDPDYRGDWFCLEPQTHTVDGVNRRDLGGMRLLAPGEKLAGTIRLELRR